MARGKQRHEKPPQGPPSTPGKLLFGSPGQDTFQQLFRPRLDSRQSKLSGRKKIERKLKKKLVGKGQQSGIFLVAGILSVFQLLSGMCPCAHAAYVRYFWGSAADLP